MLYTTITIDGKEYKARLNARACINLEKSLGENPLNAFIKVASTNELPNLEVLIKILHASLQSYNHGLSLEDVYDLYDKYVDEGNTLMDLIPFIMDVFKVSGFFKETEAKNA